MENRSSRAYHTKDRKENATAKNKTTKKNAVKGIDNRNEATTQLIHCNY